MLPQEFNSVKFKFFISAVFAAAMGLYFVTHNSQLGQVSFSSTNASFYTSQVQPILSNRCAVCHSCNTAPCQLNLTNYEGFTRGASKTLLYQPSRHHQITPT